MVGKVLESVTCELELRISFNPEPESPLKREGFLVSTPTARNPQETGIDDSERSMDVCLYTNYGSPKSTYNSLTIFDKVRYPLRNHHSSHISVRAYAVRHYRCIYDPEILNPSYSSELINDSHIV